MQETQYVVYYLWHENVPCYKQFDDLLGALAYMADIRRQALCDDIKFITMVGENANQVGKPGVDAVVDNKLPDGTDYTWTKRRIERA